MPDVHRGLHDAEAGNLDALLATFRLRQGDVEEIPAEEEDPEADTDAEADEFADEPTQ